MSIELIRFAFENMGFEIRRHIGTMLLSIILVFFISTIFFTTASIQTTIKKGLEKEPDFVVQKIIGDRLVPMRTYMQDAIIEIQGTTHITPRLYGRYFFQNHRPAILLFGVDFFEEQSQKELKNIIDNLDLRAFLANKQNMIVGSSVSKWMKESGRGDSITFYDPHGEPITLKRFATLPKESAFFGADIVITSTKNARKILGLNSHQVTDYAFDVPNELEWETIAIKVASLDNDLRIIDKKESSKAYEELFDYSGGLFLMIWCMSLLSFLMIIYQRYSQSYTNDRYFIATLRAMGWRVADVMFFKFAESIIFVLLTFIIAISLAYLYLYFNPHPFTLSLIIGNWNLQGDISIMPLLEPFTIVSLFLIFTIPYLASVLIPVWRIALTDPMEALQ